MSGRLLAILGRLDARPRRATVLLVALALLGLLFAVVTPSPAPRAGAPTAGRSVGSGERRAESSPAPGRPAAVSAAQLSEARRAAELFLAGYLRVAYRRAPVQPLRDAMPALRRELAHRQADLSPAERRRDPRLVSLDVVGNGPDEASATAMVADGGQGRCPLAAGVSLMRRGAATGRQDARVG